jgi:Domain of unknown function (DUF4266)
VRRAALVAVDVLARVPAAAAFPTGEQFDMDPMKEDGAGGVAFTGAPRWAAHTCAVCHTGAPERIGLRLEADHAELFQSGWKAKQTYRLRVVLTRTWAAAQYQKDGDQCGTAVTPYHPCDQNGFAVEMDDAGGHPVGTFAPAVSGACAGGTPPPDADVRVLADGSAVTHNGAHAGMVSWDLCWTAPAAGAGPITAYLAGVDGNGGDGTAAFPNDTTGDDVAAGAVPLVEAGAAAVPPQTGGCDSGGGASGGAVLVLIALLAARRSRRRRAAVAAVALALAGCVHVRPHQRETLAARNMKFAPDPAEDELDLHMQEAREGSAGGYGSAGGGCGCN